MSGFDTSWLDLREPADHAARSGALLEAAATGLSGIPRPVLVDLGCGTGSTVRALAPHLHAPADWVLVDHDRALLSAAGERCGQEGFRFVEADLRALETLPLGGADLVTASALFDLVSQDWLTRFAERLRDAGAGLYAALSYDGTIAWSEAHPLDRSVVEAFNAHQQTDKGFGAALGPRSGAALVAIFEAAGYRVRSAESPWRLAAGPLHASFVEGVAGAARETGRLQEPELTEWLVFRLAAGRNGTCTVGHLDVLAVLDKSSRSTTLARELPHS